MCGVIPDLSPLVLLPLELSTCRHHSGGSILQTVYYRLEPEYVYKYVLPCASTNH